MGGGD
ncbi:hypothetical protein LINGRAHAP2_LOCUS3081 [Linum grandiflorum]